MNPILKDLNSKQREAASHIDGPLLILAGAGSGKTKTLTHRIAFIVKEKKISPYELLAVTFTNKAAGEMKKRIFSLLYGKYDELEANRALPWVGTFHSVCVRILRKHITRLGYQSSFVIYDSDDQLTVIKRIMKDLQIDHRQYAPKAIKSYISSAKNELFTAELYQQNAANSPFGTAVADVFMEYEKILKQNQAVDFDDLIGLTVRLLEENLDVRDEYRRKFKYIFIDEYQDTNYAQYMLVTLLVNDLENICVVGDDAQSIYSWRGATIRNILEFEKDFHQAKVIKLEQNYRSTQNILAAANAVIAKNKQQKKKKLWTKNKAGDKVSIYRALTEKDEGKFIVKEINRLMNLNKYRYNDFAVLYRTNAQSRSLEEVFLRYNIPYRIIGGVKFYERKEIKDALAWLKLMVNPLDNLSLLRVINVPPRGISKKTIEVVDTLSKEYSLNMWETLEQIAQEDSSIYEVAENHLNRRALNSLISFREILVAGRLVMENLNPTELLLTILKKSGYEDMLKDGSVENETRMENINELTTVLKKYNDYPAEEGIKLFLEEVALITDIDNVNLNDNAVTLMTLHSAKGLEFPVVFMAGMEENLFPHSSALAEEKEMAEERRLCYVGLTRAEEHLYLICTQTRHIFGSVYANMPSRFIEDIPSELVNMIDGQEPTKTIVRSTKPSEPIVLDENNGEFRSGDLILHEKFGEGRIVQVQGGIIKVAFANQGVKSLAASIAPIKRI